MTKKKQNRSPGWEKKYHGSKEQVARRSARNKARAEAKKRGLVKKGDGKEVHHKDGNPKNNGKKNTKVVSRSENRKAPRKSYKPGPSKRGKKK